MRFNKDLDVQAAEGRQHYPVDATATPTRQSPRGLLNLLIDKFIR